MIESDVVPATESPETPALWAMRWSPPSERARWALRARGVAYREVGYIPSSHMALRLIAATGKASVPVLFADREVFPDSTSIARFADERGTAGPPLFPKGAEAEIAAWTTIADDLFARSRDLYGPAFARDREALQAAIDSPPLWARAAFPLFWRLGGLAFGRRYTVGTEDAAIGRARLREALVAAEEKRAGRDHLVGDAVTYADISMATLLGGVRSPPTDLLATPAAIVRHFTAVAEAGPWDALFAWRDAFWRRHHP